LAPIHSFGGRHGCELYTPLISSQAQPARLFQCFDPFGALRHFARRVGGPPSRAHLNRGNQFRSRSLHVRSLIQLGSSRGLCARVSSSGSLCAPKPLCGPLVLLKSSRVPSITRLIGPFGSIWGLCGANKTNSRCCRTSSRGYPPSGPTYARRQLTPLPNSPQLISTPLRKTKLDGPQNGSSQAHMQPHQSLSGRAGGL